MKTLRIALILALLLVASLVSAKGPADKITITGPGLSEPLEITDADTLAPLSFMTFETHTPPIVESDLPQNLGDGYEITRYYRLEGGRYVAFDHLHYFRDPSNGVGYVFYDGLINGDSDDDRKWFRVTLDGERMIRRVLKQNIPPTPTPEPLPSVQLTGHTSEVTVLAWSPDSQLLASSAGWVDSDDNAVRLWRSDGTLIATLSKQTMPVVNLAWSPDGKTLATGSWDNTVELWGADGTPIKTLVPGGGVPFGLSWSPDGQILAVGSLGSTTDNRLELWNLDGTLLNTLRTKYSGGKFLNVGWSPDGKYLAGGATDYAEWTADGTQVFTHDSCAHCTPAWGFAWSPDSQMWAMGNESGEVWVYNVAGDLLGQLQNSQGNVDVMAWSPDGKILAGGNSLWQFNGTTFDFRTSVNGGRISGLAWSPDSKMIATSGEGAYVRLTDVDGHQIIALTGHNNAIHILAWSPDGTTLASGSVDHTIRLWDMTKLPPQ